MCAPSGQAGNDVRKSDGTGKFAVETQLVVEGREPDRYDGFVNVPITRGATIIYPSAADLRHHTGRRYSYGRRGNPTLEGLETALTTLEGGAGVVLTPSGLSACGLALLSALKAGDHLLMIDTVYEPTRHLCGTVLKRFGIEVSYYDPLVGADIAALFRPNTAAIYLESPGSQTFEMPDVPAIVAAARTRDLVTLMDNTWATPLHFRPHDFGVDISIQAGTKYLGGHADLNLGTVSANERMWKAVKGTHGDLGITVAPEDAFLGARGLRTLALRLKRHEESALALARWLADRPEVRRVLHPGLPDDPGHAIWKRDFTGACGLFSLILQPASEEAVNAFLDNLELFGLGYSWGGFESLAVPFNAARYRTATPWNPGGPGVRLHVGLEDVGDLIADLENGFAALRAAG
ncbi:cystathionine beta-lyase [Ancylobacter terrae]|uniref:cystathionine beta-lyase n=1 Tax=Ancylobacter sp. sgz301288 TaxID=3342077 RepID=UPI00385C7366